MSIRIETRPENDLTIFTAVGCLTFDDQMSALCSFYENSPTRFVIWDLSGITGSRISTFQLRKIIAYTKQHGEKRPEGVTALVTSNVLDFGLARMSSSLADIEETPWDIVPFKSFDKALRFILSQREGNES